VSTTGVVPTVVERKSPGFGSSASRPRYDQVGPWKIASCSAAKISASL
jgi:hypothetical protein